jgi:undecaprenyl-diphosphatase
MLTNIELAMNQFFLIHQIPLINSISIYLSIIFDYIGIILITLAIAFVLAQKRDKKYSILLLIGSIVTNFSVLILKEVIARVRPQNILEMDPSFPSGHTTNATFLFGFIIYSCFKFQEFKKLKIPLIIISGILIIIIPLSRLYLGVHWLGDILAGYLLGGLILILTIYSFNLIKAKSKTF